MNARERKTIERLIKFNMMSLKVNDERVKEAPHDFNAYARLKYDEGVLVGLKMALDANRHP